MKSFFSAIWATALLALGLINKAVSIADKSLDIADELVTFVASSVKGMTAEEEHDQTLAAIARSQALLAAQPAP